ncbi:MAG: nuclear transport factor 2 family protein [Cytophagales bacterium]|nr:nuclear transport factor 2 family protein [Cytophagales bacterium]
MEQSKEIMTTQEVANRLVELLRITDYDTIYGELFSPNIISIEPEGSPFSATNGLKDLAKRGEQFQEMIQEIHSSEISDPIVAENFFTLTMKMRAI